MQRLEVSGAVRPIYGSLGVKRLRECRQHQVQNSARIPADANDGIAVSLSPSKQKRAMPRIRLWSLPLKSLCLSAT